MTYGRTDRVIKSIIRKLIDEYNRLKGLTGFDEVNLLRSVNEVYAEIDGYIRGAYLELARAEYNGAAIDGGKHTEITGSWVAALLAAYNPVSKYIYDNEFERKRSRLFEAMVASEGGGDAEAERAKRLMATQASAYAVEITDAATLQAYRDGGVEYVRWISEDDGRTCPTCAERNGVIYPIDEIPAKPHINCRCRVEAVKEDVADAGAERSIAENRNLAMGLRKPPSHILTDDEIKNIKNDARSIKVPENILRFNEGSRTGFNERHGLIYVRGDVLPDTTSMIARDKMSSKAVLAHEYYGHVKNSPSEYDPSDWRDEFRASYDAAINTPNLSDEERKDLMVDAYDRARDAGQPRQYDEKARKIIYGY